MAKVRGAAAITILTPYLVKNDLKTLVTNFNTYTTTGITATVANCTSLTTSRNITTTTANGFANAVVGQRITGTGIPTETFVESINSTTSITISKNPTTATAGTLTVTLATATINTILATDQLNEATLNISELYENNMTQASMSPASKTKTGSECSLSVSIADDRISLLRTSTNATSYGANNALITMGDQAGLTVGTASLPFSTVIIRPYIGGAIATTPGEWYIMPYAGAESQINLSFSLQNQRAYNITFTGYDPFEEGYRIMRGDPANLP